MKYIKIAMITPHGIYTPSRLFPSPVEVSPQVASNEPISGLVSFQADGYSKPVELPFYGCGLDCWYVRLDDALAHGWQAVYVLELPMVKLSAVGFEVTNV